MSNNEVKWCPLRKDKCREDCAWADIAYNIDDDGITKYVNCAIFLIACGLITSDIIIE